MSAMGRPEREYRSAQREGTPVSAAGAAETRRAGAARLTAADTQLVALPLGHKEAAV